jgi:DNA-binding NarL/FixJ family response regulator
LKKISPSVKALVASGHSEGAIVSDPSAYGFIGSLCKPFGMNDLRQALNLAFEG